MRVSVRVGGNLLSLSCCPADRGDSGERQADAETELGRQRDHHREGDLGWEIDSGKDFGFLALFFSFSGK